MGDRKSAKESKDWFQREMELLNVMAPTKDLGDLADGLSHMKLEGNESNLVMYGPLNEIFYSVNCPFVWSEYISTKDMESYIKTMEEKTESRDSDWKMFCFRNYFAFMYARLGKLSHAFKELEYCEGYVEENREDEFYREIVEGLNHCTKATRAHLCFVKGDTQLADEIISEVTPMKDLDNPSKAALISINAEVMQDFGIKCKEMAMKMMQVAIQLDPDEQGSRRGAWYYMVGKILGQIRRTEHRAGMPSREEMKMLERATKINPYPVALAALADSYREASTSAMFGNTMKVSQEVITKMLVQAKQLYTQAFELDNGNSSTLRRCGNGLMKLPAPHKDIQLAKKALEKAISVNPRSSSSYQALGTMEEKYFKNLNAALKYYELSFENGNPISGSFIVEVRMKINRRYNPIPDLDKFSNELDSWRHDMRAEFLMLKGEYLFFHQDDLLSAAKMWKEAILLSPKSENVTNHVCRFVRMRGSDKPYMKGIPGRSAFNLYDCLKFELRNVMGSTRYSDQEKEVFQELIKLSEVHAKK